MPKAVLLSIQPKWCELIASGKKTVEVRKTRPKVETPFKCYIYCTKGKANESLLKTIDGAFFIDSEYVVGENLYGLYEYENGKVIGEFMCNKIDYWQNHYKTDVMHIADMSSLSCVSIDDLLDYLGHYVDMNGVDKRLYAWHISDLVIYDNPKELSEFVTVDNEAVKNCEYRERIYNNPDFTSGAMLLGSYLCNDKMNWCEKCKTKPLKRPPQSWCYVEVISNDRKCIFEN